MLDAVGADPSVDRVLDRVREGGREARVQRALVLLAVVQAVVEDDGGALLGRHLVRVRVRVTVTVRVTVRVRVGVGVGVGVRVRVWVSHLELELREAGASSRLAGRHRPQVDEEGDLPPPVVLLGEGEG